MLRSGINVCAECSCHGCGYFHIDENQKIYCTSFSVIRNVGLHTTHTGWKTDSRCSFSTMKTLKVLRISILSLPTKLKEQFGITLAKPLRTHVFAGKNERKAFSAFCSKVFGHHVRAYVLESCFLSSQPFRNAGRPMQTVNQTRLSSYAEQQNLRSLGCCPPGRLQPQSWTLWFSVMEEDIRMKQESHKSVCTSTCFAVGAVSGLFISFNRHESLQFHFLSPVSRIEFTSDFSYFPVGWPADHFSSRHTFNHKFKQLTA